ncbi:MAG TPA: tetratricopeptide repeat protein [Roseiflexaceae bacterium]|nr:tetratricopeptide repeat protein [Roseiflexaceae bacterium]HMP41115.1 tetratricopeptide repeat protein [Roseiflexaceae bacterium]
MLGSYEAWIDETAIHVYQSHNVRALLAFLILEADRPHERIQLAAMLWPDDSTERGLTNLRQALHRLVVSIAKAEAALPAEQHAHMVPLLLVRRQSVQINPAATIGLDLRELLDLLTAVELHMHQRHVLCQECIERLQQVDRLYRGDVLAGSGGRLSQPYSDWLRGLRKHVRERVVQGLERLAVYYELREQTNEAIRWYQRMADIEPWNEKIQQRLIELLAATGQRAAALAQFERCRTALAAEFKASPSIQTRTLLSRIQNGQIRRPDPPSFSVPELTTPLIGREQDLALLLQCFTEARNRLITIVGQGGSGKTHLALELAHYQRGGFADGIYFLPLASLSSGDSLARELAIRFGLSRYDQGRSDAELVLEYVRARDMLLILDNFEQLIDAAGFLSEILQAAPQVRMLVTSRQPLRIVEERILVLEGLAFVNHPGTAEPAPAVRLFLDHAYRVHPTFAPIPREVDAISALCRFVRGMPLAIILAAGQVNRLSPTDILSLLRQDADLLISTQHNTPDRHRSVRALFESAWGLLWPHEQRALALVSIFRGGVSQAAADAILATDSMWSVAAQQANLIEALAERSIIARRDPTRYELHDLVRQYAAAELAQLLDTDAYQRLRQSYSRYYLGFVANLTDAITGSDGPSALQALRIDLENIRQAWQFAVDSADYGTMSQAIRGLRDFYRIAGMCIEGIALFDLAIGRLQVLPPDPAIRLVIADLYAAAAELYYTTGDYAALTRAADAAIQYAEPAALAVIAAQVALGKVFWRRGQTQQSLQILDTAQKAVRVAQTGTHQERQRLLSEIHYYLGVIHWVSGVLPEARRDLLAALRISRNLAYRYGEADALADLALVLIDQGKFGEARRCAEEARRIYRESQNSSGEGLSLFSLGVLALYHGEDLAALDLLTISRTLHTQAGDRQNISVAEILLSVVQMRLGDYQTAYETLNSGLAICSEIGHVWALGIGLSYQSLWLLARAEFPAAAAVAHQAVDVCRQAGLVVFEGFAHAHLGQALAALGATADAEQAFRQSITLREQIGQRHLLAEPLTGLMQLAFARGDTAQAIYYATSILEVIQVFPIDVLDQAGQVWLALYKVLQAADDPRAALIRDQATTWLEQRHVRLFDSGYEHLLIEQIPVHQRILALRPVLI